MRKTREYILEAIKKGYYVDENGNAYSSHKQLKLKNSQDRLSFAMRYYGERVRINVHQFIAYLKFGEEMFKSGIEVRHLDNNSLNNKWENIAIGTHSENIMDLTPDYRFKRALAAGQRTRRFSDDEVKQIWKDRENGLTYGDLCEKYNTSKSTLFYFFNKAVYSGKNPRCGAVG